MPDLRRHRARRLLRRLALTVVVLILLGILAFGGLLIFTPSVGNARQLVAAQDRAHHAAYPGPAVAARFAESLVATEDKRFYSEPGIDLFAVGRVGLRLRDRAWPPGRRHPLPAAGQAAVHARALQHVG